MGRIQILEKTSVIRRKSLVYNFQLKAENFFRIGELKLNEELKLFL